MAWSGCRSAEVPLAWAGGPGLAVEFLSSSAVGKCSRLGVGPWGLSWSGASSACAALSASWPRASLFRLKNSLMGGEPLPLVPRQALVRWRLEMMRQSPSKFHWHPHEVQRTLPPFCHRLWLDVCMYVCMYVCIYIYIHICLFFLTHPVTAGFIHFCVLSCLPCRLLLGVSSPN